ncbi:MAG: hypothetical protein ACOCVG_00785, partial [Verrucomicrobiota bacterium]
YLNPCGCQPMWRRTLHDNLGGFDETYAVVGDHDFVLRAALRTRIQRVDDALGSFLDHPGSLSVANQAGELRRLRDRYHRPECVAALYAAEGWPISDAEVRGQAFIDCALRGLGYLSTWGGRWISRANTHLARICLETALTTPLAAVARKNLEVLRKLDTGDWSADEEAALALPGRSDARAPDNLALLQPLPACLPRPPAFPLRHHPGASELRLGFARLAELGLGMPLQPLLRELDRHARERPLVIWGLGDKGRLLPGLLAARGFPVAGFVDSNSELQGRRFHGLDIKHPETLTCQPTRPYIIFGSWQTDALTDAARQLEFEPQRDFYTA